MSEKPAPNPQPQGQFWLRQPDASLTGECPDVPSPFKALQKPGDERKPGRMRELFRRKIVVPVLKRAIDVLERSLDDDDIVGETIFNGSGLVVYSPHDREDIADSEAFGESEDQGIDNRRES